MIYNAIALVLSALAVATAGVILALRRRRPWDAATLRAGPGAVPRRHRQLGLPRHRARRPRAGRLGETTTRPGRVLLGLGGAAKMWPLFLLGPILILGLRAGRCGRPHRRRHRPWSSLVR